jgi:hypothetical protein
MKKYQLTVTFRYRDVPTYEWGDGDKTVTTTIDTYDTIEQAIDGGNMVLHEISRDLTLRDCDKFSLDGGGFGLPKLLVSNSFRTTKGVTFFAEIKELSYVDVKGILLEALCAYDRYWLYQQEERIAR